MIVIGIPFLLIPIFGNSLRDKAHVTTSSQCLAHFAHTKYSFCLVFLPTKGNKQSWTLKEWAHWFKLLFTSVVCNAHQHKPFGKTWSQISTQFMTPVSHGNYHRFIYPRLRRKKDMDNLDLSLSLYE